jgi:hypothetical protein
LTNGPVCLKRFPLADSAEVDRLLGALDRIFLVDLALVLSLPLRVNRVLPALTRSVFFEDRLTKGPFCGYALEREDSAERLLLRGGFIAPPEAVVRCVLSFLPDRVNWLLLDLPVSVLFEDRFTNGPL